MQATAQTSPNTIARARRHRRARSSQRVRRTRTLLVLGVLIILAVLFWFPGQTHKVAASGEPVTYTVQRGDTLWEIAGHYAGGQDVRLVIRAIQQANGLQTASIHPGQELIIPQR